MGQRPNELTPHESLAHYWGAELRALRTHHEMSLAELARTVHCDPSYLAKLERAERPVPAHLAESCDHALDAHGALIRLHTLTESDRRLAPSTTEHAIHEDNNTGDVANAAGTLLDGTALPALPENGEEIVIPVRTADGRVVFVSVPRRLFLQGLGSATVGVVALPVTGSAVPTASVSAAVDVNPVEHFRQMLQVLGDNDRLFGSRQVIPVVREQIAIMQQLRSRWRGADQHALLRVQAQYTQFHGWLYQETGEYRLAESCIDRALALSQIAEDHELAAYIMARKAQLASDMGICIDAVGAAEQACRIAPPHSRVAALAPAYAGHGYALNGDSVSMERAYDRALALLEASDAAPGSPPGPWFDRQWIALRRARSLAVLGDHHRAAQSYLDEIENVPSRYRRGRGIWLARTSRALAGDHQVERAATLGMEALAIGADTGSAGTHTELAQLNQALAPWNTVPAVVDFRTAMKDTVVRQA